MNVHPPQLNATGRVGELDYARGVIRGIGRRDGSSRISVHQESERAGLPVDLSETKLVGTLRLERSEKVKRNDGVKWQMDFDTQTVYRRTDFENKYEAKNWANLKTDGKIMPVGICIRETSLSYTGGMCSF